MVHVHCRNSKYIAIVTIYLSLLFLEVPVVKSQEILPKCQPSPMNFRTLYLNSCSALSISSTKCQDAWGRFSSAFAGIDPNDVTAMRYRDYFQFLLSQPEPNTSLFWSSTNELVKLVSCMCQMVNVLSSTNTPATAIINHIGEEERWCGTTDPQSTDGIEYEMNCPCTVSFAFFQEFSTVFAQAAEGVIFYLGYGERESGTFDMNSFFGKYEIPNLRKRVVTKAIIMVVHREGMGESCGEGTVIDLQNVLRASGFSYTCYNILGDPKNSAEVQALANCASVIISAEQQGIEPSDSSKCFTKDASGSSAGCTWTGPWRVALVVFMTTLVAIGIRL